MSKKVKTEITKKNSEILIYEAQDGKIKIDEKVKIRCYLPN